MTTTRAALVIAIAFAAGLARAEVDLAGAGPWQLALESKPVVRVELFCDAKPGDGSSVRLTFGKLGWIDVPLRVAGWNARRIPRLVAPEVTVARQSGEANPIRARVVYAPEVPEAVGAPAALCRVDLPPWKPPGRNRSGLECGMMTAYFEKGLSDAFDEPATGKTFDEALRRLGCTALRFPGGSFAYGYAPLDPACLKIYAAAKLGVIHYNYWDLARWGWVGAEAFFRRCARLGLVAWYQLDPGFYCDAAEGKAYQIAAFDKRENLLPVSADARRRALDDVRRLARIAQACGAKVVWEIGNEDYCYYSPGAYAGIVGLFTDALRGVDPSAKVAACGDSYSWSDLSWQAETSRLLAAKGLPDYWSVHLYAQGQWMCVDGKWLPRPWDTPLDIMTQAVGAWDDLRHNMYPHNYRDNLWAHGRHAPFVLTEFNVFCPGDDEGAKGQTVARAIGEAAAYPSLCGLGEADPISVGVFFHDLVRSGDDQNWFQRLDYYPGLDPAHRYAFQAPAEALSLVARHATGSVVARQDAEGVRVLASSIAGGYWVTAVNYGAQPASLSLSAPAPAEAEVTVLAGGTRDYDYGLSTSRPSPASSPFRARWRLALPPGSVTAVFVSGSARR